MSRDGLQILAFAAGLLLLAAWGSEQRNLHTALLCSVVVFYLTWRCLVPFLRRRSSHSNLQELAARRGWKWNDDEVEGANWRTKIVWEKTARLEWEFPTQTPFDDAIVVEHRQFVEMLFSNPLLWRGVKWMARRELKKDEFADDKSEVADAMLEFVRPLMRSAPLPISGEVRWRFQSAFYTQSVRNQLFGGEVGERLSELWNSFSETERKSFRCELGSERISIQLECAPQKVAPTLEIITDLGKLLERRARKFADVDEAELMDLQPMLRAARQLSPSQRASLRAEFEKDAEFPPALLRALDEF